MSLQNIIETAFDNRANFGASDCPSDVRSAVEEVLASLDNGSLRVAQKIDGEWFVHQWVKKAVLLSFKINDNKPMNTGELGFYDCFIGARSEIVEGVIVEEGSVISMGVYIGQSTKIYDRETGEIHYGRVPTGSVVVSGSLPSKDGTHSLYCAVIVKKVDAQTRAKTSLNDLLRTE